MSRKLLTALVFSSLVVPAFAQPPKEKGPFKPRNDLISDFVDNPEKYKGKRLTFRLKFVGGGSGGFSLKQLAGDDHVPFKGVDPNNGAKLLLGLTIPRGLDLPAAKDDEEVIVTFEPTQKNEGKAIEIRRPNVKDVELRKQ